VGRRRETTRSDKIEREKESGKKKTGRRASSRRGTKIFKKMQKMAD
jgi:hypothetical protein